MLLNIFYLHTWASGEMADTVDPESTALAGMGVRVPPRRPYFNLDKFNTTTGEVIPTQ